MEVDQMPRKSAAALATPPINGEPPRLQPPASLSETEQAIFTAVVGACDAKHFRKSDLPLLCRFCELTALADQAGRELRENGAVLDGKPSPWIVVQEKCVRGLVALSARLRLCPQSRTDPKTTGRQRPSLYRKPWEDEPWEDDVIKRGESE
jgi:phage terminase small subunit